MLHELLLWLKLHWGSQGTRLIREYRTAFRDRDDVLRDLALFAKVNETVPSDQLERIEGRREVFRRIMAMQGIDPLTVAKFLEGDNLE